LVYWGITGDSYTALHCTTEYSYTALHCTT
jgi:hypothetical protein